MATSTRAPVRPRRGVSIESTRARTALWLLLPTIIVLALVAGYPLIRTIYLAFTDAVLLPAQDQKTSFIGFDNFLFRADDGSLVGILTDPSWWEAVWNTVKFSLGSVILETLLGLAFALVINSKIRGRGLLRTAILVPWAIPTVVSAQMWNWMYQDNLGIISEWGRNLGLLTVGQSFLSNTHTSLWALVAVDVWKTTPFMALLLLAGLQGIPSDMYEAADVDGASKVRQFFKLTLPLLSPALLVALIFRTLDALRVFDMPYVVKGYAPDTLTMSMYARQQLIDNGALGAGSAVSLLIFIIIMGFTVIYVTSLRVRFD